MQILNHSCVTIWQQDRDSYSWVTNVSWESSERVPAYMHPDFTFPEYFSFPVVFLDVPGELYKVAVRTDARPFLWLRVGIFLLARQFWSGVKVRLLA